MSIRRRTTALAGSVALVIAGFTAVHADADGADELPVFTNLGPIVDRTTDETWNPNDEFIFPSVFHAAEYLEDPLGQWYVYYAPHDAPGGINLMYADSLDGPWTQFEGNPIVENKWDPHYDVSHVSAPDVVWNEEAGEVFMYFHGENSTDRYAASEDGLAFTYGGVVMTTAQFGRNATETSYNRVFDNPYPDNGWSKAMFFMVNDTSNVRRIGLAYSNDGIDWEPQPGWVVEPGDAEGTNVAAADLWEWNGKYYVLYGSSVGNIFAKELGPDLRSVGEPMPLYIPSPNPPEDGRSSSPQVITHEGKTHMIFEMGGRSGTTIAHAVLDPDGWRDPVNTNPSDPLYAECNAPGSDEFDGDTLGEQWSVLRPADGRLRLEDGNLVMSSPPVSTADATLPQQPLHDGPWEVTTELSYAPEERYQQAGLLLRRDDANTLRATWGYANGGERFDLIWRNNGVDRFDSWTWEDTLFPPENMGGTVWLRLTSNGEWITASLSTDGVTFATLGRPVAVDALGATSVGPMAYRGATAAPDIDATFNWVRFSPTPEQADECASQEAPPVDDETEAPAPGVLSHTSGWAHGLADGNFELRWNLWWGTNASRVKLYRDGELLHSEDLVPGSPAAQQVVVPISGLPNGSHTFTAEVINSQGGVAPAPITVEVTDAAPARPVLSSDNWDGDGNYTLTADLWWGTNATAWRLLEDGTAVASGDLTAASPRAQQVRIPLTGRTAGTHTYLVEFSNHAGSTQSLPLEVSVRS
ncbi:hypothetical protein GCM10028820_19270 [Tessaracoccus terricola]